MMAICQIEEREAGRSYPRTCPTCGINGPCAKELDRKSLMATVAAQRAEIERLRAELASGSFYQEKDIDAMQARADAAEAEIKRLRAALERVADTDPDNGTEWFHDIARAALEGEKKDG
jgi:uncharacterized small protein (DUF1192 family)